MERALPSEMRVPTGSRLQAADAEELQGLNQQQIYITATSANPLYTKPSSELHLKVQPRIFIVSKSPKLVPLGCSFRMFDTECCLQ